MVAHCSASILRARKAAEYLVTTDNRSVSIFLFNLLFNANYVTLHAVAIQSEILHTPLLCDAIVLLEKNRTSKETQEKLLI